MNTFENLRREIDKIDANLISLLKQRASVVEQVKDFKNSTKSEDFTLYIKPDREYAILIKVIQSQGYSKEFFYNTWRGIISASNFLEQNLNLLAVCEQSQNDIFHHFGGHKAPSLEVDVSMAFELLQKNKHHILAFKESNIAAFNLLQTYTNIKIFAITHSFGSEKTLLCGKISLQHFLYPAVFLTTNNTGMLFNEEAKIYTSETLDTKCIGAFYPLPLQLL